MNPGYTTCTLTALDTSKDTSSMTLSFATGQTCRGIFSGDVVLYDSNTQKVSLHESRIRQQVLVGVLQLHSKVKYPKTKRRVERFQFRPLSNQFPPFLVASTLKTKYSTNVIVVIKYTQWLSTSTFPYGELVKVLGPVTEVSTLCEGLLYKYGLFHKTPRLTKVQKYTLPSTNKEYESVIQVVRKHDFAHYRDLVKPDLAVPTIMSVDPPDTLDIDDAFSYTLISNAKYTLQIYISDVVGALHLFHLESLLRKCHSPTSIYLPHRTQHMLPVELSQNILSLLPGCTRTAIVLDLVIENNTIMSENLYPAIVRNTKKYSYEQFDADPIHKDIQHRVQKLKGIPYTHSGDAFTSHSFIEKLMILYNLRVGHLLHTTCTSQGIFRCQPPTCAENPDTTVQIPVDLQRIVSVLHKSSAHYSRTEYYHATLQTTYYSHVTSPIRRLVDCANHWILHSKLWKSAFCSGSTLLGDAKSSDAVPNIDELQLDSVNHINQQVRRVQRKWQRLQMEHFIHTSNMHYFTAYILSLPSESHSQYSLYVPQYRLCIYGKLHNSEDTIVHVRLYQKVNIQIYLEHSETKPYSKMRFSIR